MNNFKKACFGAATMAVIATGSAMTASSAQALSFGDRLNFSGEARLETTAACSGGIGDVCLNFDYNTFAGSTDYATADGRSVVGASSTFPAFGVGGTTIELKDLSLVNNGVNQWKLAASVIDFLAIPGPPNVKFTLDTFVLTRTPGGVVGDDWLASFSGIFTSPNSVNGVGRFTTQGLFVFAPQNLNGTTYSATLVAVPTPALLPGLLGLGAAAWRKRKSEEEAVGA
jgi:hypothetical protein